MADLSFEDRMAVEKLLRMGSGYVLDFSNRTFQEFVVESVGLDILSEKYAEGGSSKANRLRAFFKLEENPVVGKLLLDLLRFIRQTNRNPDDDTRVQLENCGEIVARLLDDPSAVTTIPLIFISYARPDLAAVLAIVDLLSDAGLRTWFDKKDLKGGQNWEYEIRQRISEASLVLICLSTNSVDRKGFFHNEMRYAVSEALKLPKGRVYIMPVRFNDCQIPDDLRQWHALDLFARDGSRRLLNSIGDALDCGARARGEAHDAFAQAMREVNTS